MNSLKVRVYANFVWLLVFSVGIISAAFLSFASGVFFDDSYLVTTVLPEAGGLFPDQELTVLGHSIGRIKSVEVVEGGVRVQMKVEGDQVVPQNSRVQVLRRSPIGEQVLDVQPAGPGWTPVAQGGELHFSEAIVPAEVPYLLEQSAEFLQAIDEESIGLIVHELALALEGRGQALRDLGTDALDLNTTLVAGIPEFERLLDSSEAVLDVLNDHKRALISGLGAGADVMEILSGQSSNIEALLDTGVRTLVQADALIRNERANLSCLTSDLEAFSTMLNGPSTADGEPASLYSSKLDELEALLQNNEDFFGNFDITGQYDPATGAKWARILLTDGPEGGAVYPEKRPTPATRPGAACETATLGTGVNAVRQESHQPADPSSPGIEYAPLVTAKGPGQIDPPTGGPIRHPLPATGGGLALLTLASLGGALSLWRRRS
ncbi:MAG: virulence factor Mce-like protein [Glaciecola sp.]|jgi:virulence factor Mce-like protein